MNIALFGRHPSPAEHIVFPEGLPEDKINDYAYMMKECSSWLYLRPFLTDRSDCPKGRWNPPKEYHLYVEGFTPALIAFLKAWGISGSKSHALEIPPTLYLMHYQSDGTYHPQVWTP